MTANKESAALPDKHGTRGEAAIATLRRSILIGEIRPGDKLREVQLAESLGISRSTLREAIQQLVHEGLLDREKYKGVQVARIDRKLVEDLSIVRINLETVAAQSIAVDPTGARQDLLKTALREYLASGELGDPVVEQEMHLALHRAIWFAADNSVIERVWSSLESLINLVTATDFASRRGDIERQRERHKDLIERILSGDDEKVADAVREHILDNVLLVRLRPGFEASNFPFLDLSP